MEKRTTKITIEGDRLNEFIKGRISGIITGVVDRPQPFRTPIYGEAETKGWWIFKHRNINSVTYTFDCTTEELNRIVDLIGKCYNDKGKRDFGFGISVAPVH